MQRLPVLTEETHDRFITEQVFGGRSKQGAEVTLDTPIIIEPDGLIWVGTVLACGRQTFKDFFGIDLDDRVGYTTSLRALGYKEKDDELQDTNG